MVTVVNSIPQRPVNSQLVCLQPVGICIKFLFIYIRVALETAGTAGLAFSLYYRVTFLSRMYYTTAYGVSQDIRHILFLFNSIAKQPVPSNLSNISVFLTNVNFLYTFQTNLWLIHVVTFPCFPGKTVTLSFSWYPAV